MVQEYCLQTQTRTAMLQLSIHKISE